MNSIDRKLARCAREIEAAKPKGLSIKSFERDIHNWAYTRTGELREVVPSYTGAPQETTPAAPPPSTEKPPKFKVGDRVRRTAECMKQYGVGQREHVVARVSACGEKLYWESGVGFDYARNMEIIPSEPKEADGEWIQCGDDMPDLPAGLYEWKGPDGSVVRPKAASLRYVVSSEDRHKFQYRLVKQQ